MVFRGKKHKQLYEKIRKTQEHNNRYLASVYLLSADNALWSKSRDAIKQGKIAFEKILKAHMSVEAYTFYAVAKDIYIGTEHLSMSDFTDHTLLAPLTYKIIRQAVELARYGETSTNCYEVKRRKI